MQRTPLHEQGAVCHVEHRIDVAAPAQKAYDLIAAVTSWPRVFGPTVHVEQMEFDGRTERIQLWATANDEIKTWVSLRELDREGLRATFRQEVSQSPVASMSGEWVVEPRTAGSCSVLLTHDYLPVDDVPDAGRWIAEAVDRNSTRELAAMKAEAEGPDRTGLESVFEDTVEIDGPIEAVHAFLYEAQHWPERLPHVAEAELREETPGLQHLRMEARAKDGSTHTTESARVALPDHRLVYKQLVLPPLLTLHLGVWALDKTEDDRVTACSRHTVRIDPEKVEAVLGEGTSTADALAFVQGVLSANSRATLQHAKAYAEAARRA